METATSQGVRPEALLAAREDERARIAREIHDGPAQALANAVFEVEIVERQLAADPAAAGRELARLRALLERQLVALRATIHELQPPLNEARDLDAALRDAADRLAGQTGLAVHLELAAPAELLVPARRLAVLRIAQEALRNVQKHAGPARVALITRLLPPPAAADGPSWCLEVRDDGRGFEPALAEAPERLEADPATAAGAQEDAALRRRFGLRFMRQRAELIGGRLTIESAAGRGTLVRLTIPAERR